MNVGSKKRGRGWARAILIGAALVGLTGCVYAPAPYAYGGGGYYYPGYYYGPAYYGPSVGFEFGGDRDGGWHRR